MAFKDITKVLYDGQIKLDYKDKAHRYYARPRINWDLPESDAKAWGKIMYPKGTTTLLGDTLEKKGLMQWPKGLAIRELFGYYNFTDAEGNKREGFSKEVGTLWQDGHLLPLDQETVLPLVRSADTAWQRKQKKGADIGSVVHDAIEHYIRELPFDIAEQYMWNIKETFPMPENNDDVDEFEGERNLALQEFEEDVKMATLAFEQFTQWWDATKPVLFGAEDLLYSLEYNVCGTYDADLGIKPEHHPRADMFPGKEVIRCMTDWKTSNASKSKEAAMPEGLGYSYFIQSAIYELMKREMGQEPSDDVMLVSARKDGGFTVLFASELGFTMDELLDWARFVIKSYQFMARMKDGLWAHAPKVEAAPKKPAKIDGSKEAF